MISSSAYSQLITNDLIIAMLVYSMIMMIYHLCSLQGTSKRLYKEVTKCLECESGIVMIMCNLSV